MASEAGGRVRIWLVLALCLAAALFEGFDIQTIGAVAPRLSKALHLSKAALGPIFSASTIGLLIGAAVGGRLADRFGFNVALTAAVGLFGLFSTANAFAVDANSLLATRFMTGLGLGGALPNVVALASSAVPANRRGAAVGMVYAGLPFGGAMAAGVTLLGAAHEWRLVFLVGGLVPLVLAPAMVFLPRRVTRRIEDPGQKMPPVVEVLFGGGRAAATILLWVSFALSLLILYLLLNWLPTLMATRGYDRNTVAEVQLAFNLMGGLVCVASGGLLDGGRRVAVIVVVYLLFCLVLATLAGTVVAPLAEIALGGALGGIVVVAQAILYDAAPRLYPEAVRGAGVGWAIAMGRIGAVAGPLLGGVLVAQESSPSGVLMRLLPIVAAAGVGTLLQTWRARPAQAAALAA
jgi:AAHS family 3-hydroxyphenylpropionic acid transporter